ncbi:MAG TPA: glycine betaine ABC transporter substrate-binding protein [Candidatus Limnocylindrales bacterium]
MRHIRTAALGAAMLALLVGACTSGGSSPSQSTAASAPPASEAPSAAPSQSAAPAISTTLTLGGPPECPERPFCLLGLQDTYGLQFKEFVPLDAGGPLTVEAVKGGQVQVGLLFTSDPAIAVNDFVLLEDDKQLQLADNIIPVVRKDALDANPDIATLLNGIIAKLTQEELTNLNKAVVVDTKPVGDVARDWIAAQDFDSINLGLSGDITVGSTNFYEQEVLAEIFAQRLESNGATVERKFQLGNREIVFPALESGEIDVLAEYAATALEFVNGGAGQASTDPAATAAALVTALEPKGIVALDVAAATDQNGFVVTRATADQYGLTSISDLGKPAP